MYYFIQLSLYILQGNGRREGWYRAWPEECGLLPVPTHTYPSLFQPLSHTHTPWKETICPGQVGAFFHCCQLLIFTLKLRLCSFSYKILDLHSNTWQSRNKRSRGGRGIRIFSNSLLLSLWPEKWNLSPPRANCTFKSIRQRHKSGQEQQWIHRMGIKWREPSPSLLTPDTSGFKHLKNQL